MAERTPTFDCDSCGRRRSFIWDLIDGEQVYLDPRTTARPTEWKVYREDSRSLYRVSDWEAWRTCECSYRTSCGHTHRSLPPAEQCAARLNRKAGL